VDEKGVNEPAEELGRGQAAGAGFLLQGRELGVGQQQRQLHDLVRQPRPVALAAALHGVEASAVGGTVPVALGSTAGERAGNTQKGSVDGKPRKLEDLWDDLRLPGKRTPAACTTCRATCTTRRCRRLLIEG
jgi:hypothetical protein